MTEWDHVGQEGWVHDGVVAGWATKPFCLTHHVGCDELGRGCVLVVALLDPDDPAPWEQPNCSGLEGVDLERLTDRTDTTDTTDTEDTEPEGSVCSVSCVRENRADR